MGDRTVVELYFQSYRIQNYLIFSSKHLLFCFKNKKIDIIHIGKLK